MTLNANKSNVLYVHVTTTLQFQISLRFGIQFIISKIIATFHLPIGHNDRLQSFSLEIIRNFKVSYKQLWGGLPQGT